MPLASERSTASSTHCIRAWAKRGRIGVFTCSDHSSAEISPMRYRTFLIVCGSLVVLCHPLWFSTAKSVENSRDPDEQLLEDTGIGSDEASLLDYLGKLSGTGSKPLDDLIRQLGSARLEERTQAAQCILRLGYGAISALREAKENNWPDWQADNVRRNASWRSSANGTTHRFLPSS